ncbi:MAG: type II toxin-antitoxin system prevent-host-death family antitoxin [Luteolibacter sp.]
MKTATVRDLRNRYTDVLAWVKSGEHVIITQRGKAIARLVPEAPEPPPKVNWAESPAVTRDRSGERVLSAQESLDLIHEAGGKW